MSVLKFLTSAIACLSAVQAAPIPSKRAEVAFDYTHQKVRGVNLGGWFVLEPWITPSIFSQWASGGGVVDEFSYTQALGKTEAASRLTAHWQTWITEADFAEIAADGLNHVRIPIGYWALNPLPGDPYVQGQLPFLDSAIGWARTHNLKVVIDVHGAPGSQNGFDNSGRYGVVNWQQSDTTAQTLSAIRTLAERYASSNDVVTAIELLNEPMGPVLNMDAVKQFYRDGWGTVQDSSSDRATMIHDAFQDPVSYWNGFMEPASGMENVIVDTHNYQIFSPGEVSRSPAAHISTACQQGAHYRSADKWLIVGEWTGAQTDCAKWLNGLGKGARYDGTLSGGPAYGSCDGKYVGTVAGLSAADKTNIRMYVEAQMDAFEQASGWIWWNWHTESSPEWDFRDLARNGLIPQPITSRQYPNQCGY